MGPEMTMAHIADSLTKLALDMQSNSTVSGSIVIMLSHVYVRWAWLLFPAILNIASVAYLLTTIWTTHKHNVPLWKTSLVAALFHGVQHDLEPIPASRSRTVSQIDHEARNMNVRMTKSFPDGKLTLEKAN